MHICFLTGEYPPMPHGGVGSFVQTLARELVKRGHQATALGVYRRQFAGLENDQGVQVIRLPHSSVPKTGFLINGLRLRKAILELHQNQPIDVLESAELGMALVPESFPMTKLIRMHGGHHFFSVTLGSKPRPWRSWLENNSFRKADMYCGVSRFVVETTRELLSLGDTHIEVIPNPVDTTVFRPQTDVTEQAGLILFIGTVVAKKGVYELVEAMPQIVDAISNAKLLVVGRDAIDRRTGKSTTQTLKSRIPSTLVEHFEFTGPVEHTRIPSLIAKAQVIVYPSHMEAMPIAWLEGMSMGKAVVASQTGPGPELIEHGTSGLLCDPYDPSSIGEQVVRVLKSASLRKKLGQRASKRVADYYSLDVLVQRNEDFYRSILQEKK